MHTLTLTCVGASHIQVFFTIILRLATPIPAIVGLLSFITSTDGFLIAGSVKG
ncbi:hypothetical protein [Arthrobacter sp. zg-Y20]|uniref:hypothetical protein n=1 Tax=unclassified Arthrobacter TaxID=235627 RepID=UPI003FA49521